MDDKKFDSKEFGERVKQAMEKEGLTQKEISEESELSIDTIKNMTAGSGNPRAENLFLLAKALSVDADYLLGLRDSMDKRDLMLDILICLEKVFKIKIKKFNRNYKDEVFTVEENVLCIVKEFADYLNDIQNLNWLSSTSELLNNDDDDTYHQLRKKFQMKHKAMFKNVFNDENTDIQKDNDVIIKDAESVIVFGNILQADEDADK